MYLYIQPLPPPVSVHIGGIFEQDFIQSLVLFIRSLRPMPVPIRSLWVQMWRRQGAFRYTPSSFLSHFRANFVPVTVVPLLVQMVVSPGPAGGVKVHGLYREGEPVYYLFEACAPQLHIFLP